MDCSWTDIVKIVAGVIAALGGGGAIVVGLSSWLGKVWADRLMVKETAKFREDLERLTKQLERKNYVSKVRFDAEFAIYRELSVITDDMVRAICLLYASGELKVKNEADIEERCKKACISSSNFNKVLAKNAMFISQETYESFCVIQRQVQELIDWIHIDEFDCLASTYKQIQPSHEQKASALVLSYKEHCEYLREYLKNLDVL